VGPPETVCSSLKLLHCADHCPSPWGLLLRSSLSFSPTARPHFLSGGRLFVGPSRWAPLRQLARQTPKTRPDNRRPRQATKADQMAPKRRAHHKNPLITLKRTTRPTWPTHKGRLILLCLAQNGASSSSSQNEDSLPLSDFAWPRPFPFGPRQQLPLTVAPNSCC